MRKRINNLNYLIASVNIVWERARFDAILSNIILLLSGLTPLASVYLLKLAIDSVTAGIASPDKTGAFQDVMFYVVLVAAVGLLTHILAAVNGLVQERISLSVVDHISDVLHKKSIAVDLDYYENSDYYDTLHRAQRGALHKPTNAFNNMSQLLQNGISMIGMIVVLSSFHWYISAILLLAVLPGLLLRLKFSRQLYRWDRSQTAAQRHTFYYNYLLTGAHNAKEVRLYRLGPLFIQRFHDVRQILRNEKLSIANKRTLAEIAAQFASLFAIHGSFAFMAWRTINGFVTLGDLVMYYQAFQRGLTSFASLLKNAAGIYEDTLYLSNLFEFLALKPRIVSPSVPQPLFHKIQSGIVFDHVTFQYSDTDHAVLDDVSFRVKPGEHVALVGENGAGKSTLIKLLCRLYDPTNGHILVDQVDIRHYELDEYRGQISAVFQDFVQYHLRVQDNIGFGNVESSDDLAQIKQSARAAGIDPVIQRLPNGYESILGKMFEQGEELSVGEWQKIALARAFTRDAQIIILDEPTSALDARAESEIFNKFKHLSEGKTAFLISHRLSTAKLADRILVLNGGRIIEDGSHDDLLDHNGNYARMFALQSQYYK